MKNRKIYKNPQEPNLEKIKCPICGLWFRRVCSHIYQKHKMTAQEFKKEFGLPRGMGVIVPEFRKIISENAKNNFSKIEKNIMGEKSIDKRFKKGDPNLGNYIRSEEQKKQLKKHIIRINPHLSEKEKQKRINKIK
jgi:uncharacterized C2H2 Zn-finger protein